MTPAAIALAVDLGGTKAEAALVDDTGALLPGSRARAATGRTATSDELAASVRHVAESALASLPAGARLVGAGVGSAGPIALEHGLVSPLNLPAWRDFPLRGLVAETLPAGLPVTLRVDGQAIALAEHWVGAGRGVGDLIGMIVSTGIGGGLVLGGRLLPGPTGNAGHIGHIEVGGSEERCDCGGIGCVEAVASGPRTVAWARQRGFAGETGEELAAAHAAGDPVARAAVERAGHAIGQAIASATALVDVELVAIGGGFSHVAPELFVHINRAIARRARFGFVAKTRAVPSGLSGEGPLIGAAALVHRAELLG
ncbi:MAG: ROK family protein [Microbacteriaceae bacterium]